MRSWLACWTLGVVGCAAPVAAASFIRGDVDGSGVITITDPIRILGYLFLGEPSVLECESAADADDSGGINLGDAIHSLNHLFLGSKPPPAPFPDCGPDPTPDGHDCSGHAACGGGCEEQIDAIARESTLVGSCSAILRYDYLTQEPLGWQMVCGKYHLADEPTARSRAEEDTGYGDGSRMLNDPAAEDLFVFYDPPGDFGGASVVSVRTGLTLFGAAIIWDGAGSINYPKEWRPPESLGVDCSPVDGTPAFKTFDLAGEQAGLDPEAVGRLIERVRSTALFEGFSRSGYVFDAAALLYPRTVGAFDPKSAEWIVIVNAGWLE